MRAGVPVGVCCDNGDFGEEHECQKQPGEPLEVGSQEWLDQEEAADLDVVGDGPLVGTRDAESSREISAVDELTNMAQEDGFYD